jgi:protein-tyrosine phosphatase
MPGRARPAAEYHGVVGVAKRLQASVTGARKTGVLFVCMGNICRSPTAESVFREHAQRAGLLDGLSIASAGIGDWHVGQAPDNRAIIHARRRGYDLAGLRARQVTREDFARFDFILAMDLRNLHDLKALCPPDYKGCLGLFLDFAPHLGLREVPDPYHGGAEGFETVLELTERACQGLLAHLRRLR